MDKVWYISMIKLNIAIKESKFYHKLKFLYRYINGDIAIYGKNLT